MADGLVEVISEAVEASAVDVELMEIAVPRGSLGLEFEDEESGLIRDVARDSPLGDVCYAGMVLLEIDGARVTVLSNAEIEAVLRARADRPRRLKFRVSRPGSEQTVKKSLFVAGAQLLNVSFLVSSRPPRISDIRPSSTLLGEVAVGAELLAVEDVDVSGMTWEEARYVYDRARRQPFYTLTFDTPVVRGVDLSYVQFCPRLCKKTGTYEKVQHLVDRANHFLVTSQLEYINVETITCDGSIKHLDHTRHRTGGENTLVYKLVRVWFNRLAPANARPSVRAAIARLREQTSADIKAAYNHDCVLA